MYRRQKNVMFLHEVNCVLFRTCYASENILEAVKENNINSARNFVLNIYIFHVPPQPHILVYCNGIQYVR